MPKPEDTPIIQGKLTLAQIAWALTAIGVFSIGGTGLTEIFFGVRHSLEERAFIEKVHDEKIKEDKQLITQEEYQEMEDARIERDELKKKVQSIDNAVLQVEKDVEQLRSQAARAERIHTEQNRKLDTLISAIPNP